MFRFGVILLKSGFCCVWFSGLLGVLGLKACVYFCMYMFWLWFAVLIYSVLRFKVLFGVRNNSKGLDPVL